MEWTSWLLLPEFLLFKLVIQGLELLSGSQNLPLPPERLSGCLTDLMTPKGAECGCGFRLAQRVRFGESSATGRPLLSLEHSIIPSWFTAPCGTKPRCDVKWWDISGGTSRIPNTSFASSSALKVPYVLVHAHHIQTGNILPLSQETFQTSLNVLAKEISLESYPPGSRGNISGK